MRQLQGDVRLQLFRRDTVEVGLVFRDDRASGLGVFEPLAKKRRVRPQTLLIEAAEDRDGFVEGLAGDEA